MRWKLERGRRVRPELSCGAQYTEHKAMGLASQLLLVLRSYSLPVWATIISGLFVVVSLSLSLFLLFNHLSAYKNPEVGFMGRFLV
jgi:hypothetical protein